MTGSGVGRGTRSPRLRFVCVFRFTESETGKVKSLKPPLIYDFGDRTYLSLYFDTIDVSLQKIFLFLRVKF